MGQMTVVLRGNIYIPVNILLCEKIPLYHQYVSFFCHILFVISTSNDLFSTSGC